MSSTVINTKQPRGLYVLFFTQMWERFSYYGMRALLILYMTEALKLGDTKSYAIYGAWGTLVYATPLIGGVLADRYLGYRTAIIMGGILMALGHFCMAIQYSFCFYTALALLICGNGLLKPNIASLLGRLYEENDIRRDAGFTLFYVGVNLGGFLAPIICGFIGQEYGWHYGFGLAGIGMLIGLWVFIVGQKHCGEHGFAPDPVRLKQPLALNISMLRWIQIACVVTVPLVVFVIRNNFDGLVLALVSSAMGLAMLWMIYKSERQERLKLITLVILMFFAMLFWAFNEQIGSSLNLFTERNIDRHLFSFVIPASMFQSINPLVILLCGPLFASLWMYFGKRNHEPSTALKFFLAMLQLAIGFLFFAFGAKQAMHHDGQASILWLFLGYFFMTTGELCLEPVGIAVVSRLSPLKTIGLMMGCWYLADGSFSNYAAAWIASFASAPAENIGSMVMAELYSKLFLDIAYAAFAISIIILLLTPLLHRMMGEIKQSDANKKFKLAEDATAL